MSAREYDQERYVRETEVHEHPTESIRVRPREVVHEHAGHDYVVEEGYVERPVYAYEHSADAVREDYSVDHVLARRAMLDRVTSAIWFVTGLLEIAIGLRVAFLLLDANESSGFVRFIYGLTNPFVAPFEGIFNDPAAEGSVLDSAGLMAMVIYALAAWAIVRLVWLIFDRPDTGVRHSVREVHRDGI